MKTPNNFEEKLEKILDRYTNWIECEERHIHSDDPEFADERDWDEDNHREFDDTKALKAISTLCEEEVKRARPSNLNISFLRQWLNEDRITDPERLVTNEMLEYWLFEDRIKELKE